MYSEIIYYFNFFRTTTLFSYMTNYGSITKFNKLMPTLQFVLIKQYPSLTHQSYVCLSLLGSEGLNDTSNLNFFTKSCLQVSPMLYLIFSFPVLCQMLIAIYELLVKAQIWDMVSHSFHQISHSSVLNHTNTHISHTYQMLLQCFTSSEEFLFDIYQYTEWL